MPFEQFHLLLKKKKASGVNPNEKSGAKLSKFVVVFSNSLAILTTALETCLSAVIFSLDYFSNVERDWGIVCPPYLLTQVCSQERREAAV